MLTKDACNVMYLHHVSLTEHHCPATEDIGLVRFWSK